MNFVKVKSNQYAELAAFPLADGGHMVAMRTRLYLTDHGELFRELLREAMRSGKFDSPTKLVEFCEIATNSAIMAMATNPALAIEAPPRSAINRKIAKLMKDEDHD